MVDLGEECTVLLPAWAAFSPAHQSGGGPGCPADPREPEAPASAAVSSSAAAAAAEVAEARADAFEPTEIPSTVGKSADVANTTDVDSEDEGGRSKSPPTLVQGSKEYNQVWGI